MGWMQRVRPGRERHFRLYLVLSLALVGMAWLLSALPPQQSGAQSGWLQGMLERVLGTPVSEALLRKLAHFTEYALIGFFACLALQQLRWRPVHLPLLLMLCLMAALVDESIQLLSGRGPAILDVWIDGAGALCGMGLALGIAAIFSRRSPKAQ